MVAIYLFNDWAWSYHNKQLKNLEVCCKVYQESAKEILRTTLKQQYKISYIPKLFSECSATRLNALIFMQVAKGYELHRKYFDLCLAVYSMLMMSAKK